MLGLGLSMGLGSGGGASGETIILLYVHGDSRAGIVGQGYSGATDQTGVSQWVASTAGVVDYGYAVAGLTAGLTTNITPIQNISPDFGDNANYICAARYIAKEIMDSGLVDQVVITSAGRNGGGVVETPSNNIGPLPATYTAESIAKASDAYDAVVAANPGATIRRLIVTIDVTNDILAATGSAATLHPAKVQQLTDLRTATGFSSATILVIGTLQNTNAGQPLMENAQRIAALADTSDAYYHRLGSGYTWDNIHEGPEDTNGFGGDLSRFDIDKKLEAWAIYGQKALIALGYASGTDPAFADVAQDVTEASDNEIILPSSSWAYWSINPATSDGSGALSPSYFALSPDLELTAQTLRHSTGTWPAYAGDSTDVKRVMLDYITGDRVTGSIIVTSTVVEAAAITYLAADNFNRANTGGTFNALGTTSGIDGSGDGVSWVGWGDIVSNKQQPGGVVNAEAFVNVASSAVIVQAQMTVGADRPSYIYGASTISSNNASGEQKTGCWVRFGSDGTARYSNSTLGGSSFSGRSIAHPPGQGAGSETWGSSSALAVGTYTIRLEIFDENHATRPSEIDVYVDDVLTMTGPGQFDEPISDTGTYAGLAVEWYDGGVYFEDFKVWANPA